jgi:predicted nucleic acid-binding protein
MRFFDASALVKRYVREAGSAKVARLLRSDAVAVSRLSEVEVVSALSRRAREGAFTPAERDRACAAFDRDLASFVIVELNPAVTASARSLLQRHVLRSGDSIQLASCLYLQHHLTVDVPLVAFDRPMIEAWRAEGFRVA